MSFDYAMVLRGTEKNKLKYKFECKCGSRFCRKFVTENDWKIPELQIKYLGYFQPHIQDVLDENNSTTTQ